MTTLLEYFQINYSRCPQNQSIIDSRDFLSIAAKLQAILILPVNLFGIYCILYQSPKYMITFRWHLLHLHFWFMMLSICYSLLTTPYYFFPANVRCSAGFLRYFASPSNQLHLIYGVYGGVITSVILLFENRHSHLVISNFKLQRVHRVVLGVVNFIFGSFNIIALVIEPEHQEHLKMAYLKILPCPNSLYFDSCSVVIEPRSDAMQTFSNVGNLLALFQLVFFIVHSAVYLRKSRDVETFSARTKSIQKAFFYSALAQVAAPLGVLLAPMIVLMCLLSTQIYLQGLINICVLLIPWLSIFSTASLIIFNAPYRKFVKRLLGFRWPKTTKIQATVMSSL